MSDTESSALLAGGTRRALGPPARFGGRAALLLLPVLLLAAGCESSGPTDPATAAGARYLFDVELQNHAFGPPGRWLGLVVEADGAVYGYDRSGEPARMCDHYWHWAISGECSGRVLTEAELVQRYATGRSLLAEIPLGDLARRSEQARRVADGPFDVPNRACNDFGVLSLVAFQSQGGLYTPAVIRLEGDQMRQNLSPGAVELTPWLLELAERLPALAAWRNGARDCRPD